jgi:cell division protein FtsI/penicillin-binding protein 2
MLLVAVILAGLVWSRLAYWQIARHGQLTQQAQAMYHEVVELPAVRGAIFDRNLKQLVVNTAVYSAFVAPDQVSTAQRERVATGLVSVLGVDKAKLMATLASGSKFAYVQRRFPKEKADQLKALKLPGVGLEDETQRSYLPGIAGGTLAANLLGFVTYDGKGQYGLEQKYQTALGGTPGYISSYRDLANREIVLGSHTHQNPINGTDLVLSLDGNIQYAAEQALADGVKKYHAESGSVLIMDPTSGGIVAWVDYPSFNANDFTKTDTALFKDNIAGSVYEPGSVMKVVTLAGAIDKGAIAPNTVINDPGVMSVGGYRIYDWDHRNHGNVDYTYVLAHSLNVGAMKAMQAEGHAAFYSYLQGFGLTKPSGIDVGGIEECLLPPAADKLSDSQYATMAFGQGIDVNMVQMLAAVNVIANGGKYAPPHVVERIGNRINPVILQPQRQVVSPETAAKMTEMMKQVVQNGSGWSSRVKGFEKDQAGKTGTAQIPVNGQYTLDVWASFVGFLPAQNPKFTMLVVIRKPHVDGADRDWTLNDGYFTAAPIWKSIAQTMVVDWHITPH